MASTYEKIEANPEDTDLEAKYVLLGAVAQEKPYIYLEPESTEDGTGIVTSMLTNAPDGSEEVLLKILQAAVDSLKTALEK